MEYAARMRGMQAARDLPHEHVGVVRRQPPALTADVLQEIRPFEELHRDERASIAHVVLTPIAQHPDDGCLREPLVDLTDNATFTEALQEQIAILHQLRIDQLQGDGLATVHGAVDRRHTAAADDADDRVPVEPSRNPVGIEDYGLRIVPCACRDLPGREQQEHRKQRATTLSRLTGGG